MRLFAFIISLLMLAGAIDADRGPLILLVILTGISAFHIRPWSPLSPRPILDIRIATFVIAVLLLAGAVDATRNWLIILTIVAGLAAFMPGIISLDHPRRPLRRRRWGGWDWDEWSREAWR